MNFCSLSLALVISALNCEIFSYCRWLLNGISCIAIATAIFMTNPMHNVLNQFNTQTTLHRHCSDGILSSIKMIHSLFRSYTTNNSQQSPFITEYETDLRDSFFNVRDLQHCIYNYLLWKRIKGSL